MSMTIPALRPSNASLADIVDQARKGDAHALSVLYYTYSRQLFRLAYRLIGSREDAEDVVHDVFVGLPEALARYEERGRLDVWLRRVTVRVALMRQRSRDRRGEASLYSAGEIPAASGVTLEQLELQAAVNALPLSLRTVLVLKEMEGYSHAEIATLLGISAVTSRVRLYRAIRTVRRQLEGER